MSEKKTYETPSVVVHGSFEELTQQNKFSGFDDGISYEGNPIGS